MAKIHLKSLHDPESYTPWRVWVDEWVPDDIDLVMERYDPEKGEGGCSPVRRVATAGESCISAPPAPRQVSPRPAPPVTTHIPFTRFTRPMPAIMDPFASRRAAARRSFQEQVDAARNHTASVLSKIGNGR